MNHHRATFNRCSLPSPSVRPVATRYRGSPGDKRPDQHSHQVHRRARRPAAGRAPTPRRRRTRRSRLCQRTRRISPRAAPARRSTAACSPRSRRLGGTRRRRATRARTRTPRRSRPRRNKIGEREGDLGAVDRDGHPVRGVPSATSANSAKIVFAVFAPLVATTKPRSDSSRGTAGSAATAAIAAEMPGTYPTTARPRATAARADSEPATAHRDPGVGLRGGTPPPPIASISTGAPNSPAKRARGPRGVKAAPRRHRGLQPSAALARKATSPPIAARFDDSVSTRKATTRPKAAGGGSSRQGSRGS